jgi:hypothetical protein
MRFSLVVIATAVGALLITGGVTIASTVDQPSAPRPVGFLVGVDTR